MDHDQAEADEKTWGGVREGAGRPKGRPSLKRAAQAIAELEEKFPGWSPVVHFAAVANDQTLDPVIRLDAAKAAAPYLHARPKPVEMEPDALVELETRLLQAKVEAAATSVSVPGLAERLQRAHARMQIIVETGCNRAPDDPATDLYPLQPAPEACQATSTPHPGRSPETATQPHPTPAPEAPAPYSPILPIRPAAAEWSTPVSPWPERNQGRADVDHDTMSGQK